MQNNQQALYQAQAAYQQQQAAQFSNGAPGMGAAGFLGQNQQNMVQNMNGGMNQPRNAQQQAA
jgi:hypothetical protein